MMLTLTAALRHQDCNYAENSTAQLLHAKTKLQVNCLCCVTGRRCCTSPTKHKSRCRHRGLAGLRASTSKVKMPHATNLHVLLVLCAVSYHAVAESAVPLWTDPNMPVAERVEALLANMSITDKLWQLQRPDFNTNLYTTGCAVLEYPSIYANAANATVVAQRRNAIQKGFLSSGPGARLGIPVSFRLFSIHGAEAFGTTFPEGPGMGATFDPGLGVSIAQVITSEARALGADMSLFVINLWADARFGRQEEGFSEEPTLTAAFAGAVVLGSHGSLGVPPDAYLDNTTGQIAGKLTFLVDQMRGPTVGMRHALVYRRWRSLQGNFVGAYACASWSHGCTLVTFTRATVR